MVSTAHTLTPLAKVIWKVPVRMTLRKVVVVVVLDTDVVIDVEVDELDVVVVGVQNTDKLPSQVGVSAARQSAYVEQRAQPFRGEGQAEVCAPWDDSIVAVTPCA
mmetsp:Transcript_58846/g.149343  ORF Transcript_58846/g.149343 Transcript_58846/m.149343 type:complete len:105 (+) Transcript_58846:990-1304(+)